MNESTQRAQRGPICLECLHRVCSAYLSADRSAATVWRPWLITPKDIEREQQRQVTNLNFSSGQPLPTPTEDKVPSFQHPVKLLWPKSKCFDYLYEDAADLLMNFPVQATISFYQENDSESEHEDND